MVVKDNLSKFSWTVPLKNKNAQTIKDSFENIVISWERKPGLFETDRCIEINNNNFKNFLNNNNIKHYSSNNSYVAVFAERFIRTIRDLLKQLVFEKADDNWIDVILTMTKHYNNRMYSSINLTPI